MKLNELTIHKAHEMLKQKEISSVELTRAVLDRIEAVDDKVGAYITVAGDMARKQAQLRRNVRRRRYVRRGGGDGG